MEPAEQNTADTESSKPRDLLIVYVENEHLKIPILSDDLTDSSLLEQFRMFYRYLKLKRGLVELIIPRTLVRIDCITVSGLPFPPYYTTNAVSGGRKLTDGGRSYRSP